MKVQRTTIQNYPIVQFECPHCKKMNEQGEEVLEIGPGRGVLTFDLAAKAQNRIPADVAEAVKKQPGVPVLVRTVANRQLSEKKLRELAKYIEDFY